MVCETMWPFYLLYTDLLGKVNNYFAYLINISGSVLKDHRFFLYYTSLMIRRQRYVYLD